MTTHTMKRFEDELIELKEKILSMGGMVEKAIRRSQKALTGYDLKRARKVIERDRAINAMEVEIDELASRLLALWQPAAGDLRFIIASIKIVTDLERIGDLAEGIADEMIRHQDEPLNHLDTLELMFDRASRQLRMALDAFARGDVETSLQTIDHDKKIDALFAALQRETLTYMMEDPRQITRGLMQNAIGRALERIGDHSVNIAEMVIYMVQGHDVRHVDHDTAQAIVAGEIEDED